MPSNANASVSSSTPSKASGSKDMDKVHNKTGKNQYKDRPLLDDPHVAELLNAYHLKGITDNRIISNLLLEEHGVILGERSVYRRKKMLGLWASKHTTQELSEAVKRQLVAAQMAKDPSGRLGARVVKQRVFQDTGLHLTRDYIRAEMKRMDPAAHAARGPAHIIARQQQRASENQVASNSTSTTTTTSATNNTSTAVHPQTQHLSNTSGTSNTDPSSGTHGLERNVHSTRRPPPSTANQPSFSPVIMIHPTSNGTSSGSQSPSSLQTEHAPPSGPPALTIQTFSTSFLRPLTQFSAPDVRASTFQLSTPSQVQQSSHSQSPLRRSTPPPSTSSFSIHNAMETNERDSWADDGASEDGLFSPSTPVGDQAHEAPGNIISEPHTTTQTTTQTSAPLTHPGLPPSASNQTSAAMEDIVRAVQESAPKMQDLTRFIESLRLEDEGLSAESYDVVLRGMETAALLERQLSRVISLARHRDPGRCENGSGS